VLWVVGPCRYSAFLSGFVYPCVVHWTWSNDAWLADGSGPRGGGEGYKDFAGSGVVHITGGTAALIGALAVGPRSAVKSMSYTHKRLMMAHSIPLVSLGTTILIFGFIGFNGGSVERMDSIEDACKMSLAVVNTMLAAATGSIMMTFSFKLVFRHWNFGSTCNGAIAGMVAIAAGAGEYRPWCGAVVGAIGGVVAFVWSLVLHHIGVDDAIDAISVHLGAGIWGVIAAPLFNQVDSIFYDDSQSSWTTLAWNVAGALVIMTWTSCNMILFFGMLRFFDQLRIISDVHGDTREIDELTHQEKAYVFDGVNEKVPMVHVNDDGNMNDQGQDGDQDQDQDGEQGTLEFKRGKLPRHGIVSAEADYNRPRLFCLLPVVGNVVPYPSCLSRDIGVARTGVGTDLNELSSYARERSGGRNNYTGGTGDTGEARVIGGIRYQDGHLGLDVGRGDTEGFGDLGDGFLQLLFVPSCYGNLQVGVVCKVVL